MPRDTLPTDRLTVTGRGRRRNARTMDTYGLLYPELCSLVAIVARYRHGLTTVRSDIAEALADDEIEHVPGFDPPVRKRLVKVVSRRGNVCVVEPTSTAVAKFAGYGREPVAGAAE